VYILYITIVFSLLFYDTHAIDSYNYTIVISTTHTHTYIYD